MELSPTHKPPPTYSEAIQQPSTFSPAVISYAPPSCSVNPSVLHGNQDVHIGMENMVPPPGYHSHYPHYPGNTNDQAEPKNLPGAVILIFINIHTREVYVGGRRPRKLLKGWYLCAVPFAVLFIAALVFMFMKIARVPDSSLVQSEPFSGDPFFDHDRRPIIGYLETNDGPRA